MGEGIGAYAVAQELFHAFQADGGFYSDDKPKPNSTIETEGDIATVYVMFEAGLGAPVYGDWGEYFQFDAMNGVPKLEKVQSAEYQQNFQKAVDKRIEYYCHPRKEPIDWLYLKNMQINKSEALTPR